MFVRFHCSFLFSPVTILLARSSLLFLCHRYLRRGGGGGGGGCGLVKVF